MAQVKFGLPLPCSVFLLNPLPVYCESLSVIILSNVDLLNYPSHNNVMI